MSRIINTNSGAKIRSQNQRTIAEILRRLSAKNAVDHESKDMAAALVFALREIFDTVDQAAKAWEKRGYWMKADRFLREWEWSREAAANLEDVIRNDAWDLLPRLLADLYPHTADIQIKAMTRKEATWHGAFRQLLSEPPSEQPW